MKKQIEGIKSDIRKYIDNCEEREIKRLNKENWKGLTNLINSFVHKIDNGSSINGHYRRTVTKEELIEYAINYLRKD